MSGSEDLKKQLELKKTNAEAAHVARMKAGRAAKSAPEGIKKTSAAANASSAFASLPAIKTASSIAPRKTDMKPSTTSGTARATTTGTARITTAIATATRPTPTTNKLATTNTNALPTPKTNKLPASTASKRTTVATGTTAMADKTNVATLITTNKPATVAASTAAKTGKANIATPVTATMRPNALNPIKETVDAVPAMSALPPNATAVERSAWAANKAQRREAALRAQKEANAKSHTATIPNNNIHAAPVSRKRKAEVSKRDIEPNKRSSRVHSASVRPAAGFNPFHGLPLSEEQKADIEKSKAERLAKFEKAKAKAAAAAHKMFEERQKKYAGPSGHIITPEKKRAHEAKPTKKRKRFQDENEDDADDIDDSVPAPSEGRDEPAHKKRKTNCVARPSGASAAENTEPAQKNSRSVAPKVVAPRRRLSDTSVVHPTYSISNILSEMDAAAANAPVFDRRYDSFVVVTAKPREKADRLEEKAKWAKFHGLNTLDCGSLRTSTLDMWE